MTVELRKNPFWGRIFRESDGALGRLFTTVQTKDDVNEVAEAIDNYPYKSPKEHNQLVRFKFDLLELANNREKY